MSYFALKGIKSYDSMNLQCPSMFPVRTEFDFLKIPQIETKIISAFLHHEGQEAKDQEEPQTFNSVGICS